MASSRAVTDLWNPPGLVLFTLFEEFETSTYSLQDRCSIVCANDAEENFCTCIEFGASQPCPSVL